LWATNLSTSMNFYANDYVRTLAQKGYEAMLAYYEKIAPHLNEPLYTRTVRTVVGEALRWA
jgi:hypothetical protein